MKKIMIVAMLILSTVGVAQLPSWGMTENQYKMPNFNSKMKEIGTQASKKNWLLKITAPKDWHKKIRMGLTDSGALNVQVNFKDSLYQSIAIEAAKGIKVANVSSSSTETTTVQKQVVIDKPEIESDVEAPNFEKLEIKSNNEELLESINSLEIAVPKPTKTVPQKESRPVAAKPAPKPAAKTQVEAAVVKSTQELSEDAKTEVNKEFLRKKHARTKRVDKFINYNNLTDKDELFIQEDVVLVKRFINRGVVLFFWMKESYDPTVHKLVEKGSGKYRKDQEAVAGDTPTNERVKEDEVEEEVAPTKLDFVAVDTDIDTQDDLRMTHARNKGVEVNITASQLKKDDILYVMNNTVLVERPLTSSQSAFFWLVGDTTITREVDIKNDNRFVIR